MVDAHQTGAVRKYGFDLQQVDHVGDALHDIAFFQYAGSINLSISFGVKCIVNDFYD